MDTLQTYLRILGKVVDKNSPTILTALGVAGLVSTVIFAIRATPKALEILEMEDRFREEEWKNNRDSGEPRTALDTIELTWKEYIPTAAMGLVTIGCMVGSNHINLRRNAALASLFSITESALREYQSKVVEQIGVKKEEIIRGEIAQEHLDKNPSDEKTIVLTGNGDFLCFDAFSSRYFRSNVQNLQREEIKFNQKLLREGWLNINEFYYEIGLEPIELGDEMGWIAERNIMELKFSTKMAKNDEPCLVLGYRITPHHI